MQSFENKPPSPMQRPGASLKVDIGSKSRGKAPSPPRTPIASQQARIGRGTAPAASRALRIRTGPWETFLDDITPIDAGRYHAPHTLRIERDSQDSHDLSISPQQVTRDSLVDHMLLSFDQLQEGAPFGAPTQSGDGAQIYPGFADDENFTNYATSRNGYTQGQGSSYSSDFEGNDTTGRAATQLNRGRRSNSSSNFQTGLARLNSIRSGANSSSSTLQRPPQTQPRGTHSRSGKSSKGSSAGSLDLGYTQATVNPRWTHGRSSSFDFGQDRQMLNRLDAGATTLTPYDYDAAPTPTVPAGPRRQQPPLSPNPVYDAEIMPAPPIPMTLERKRSTKSSKSAYQKPADGLSMSFNHGANESTRELPALPAFVKEVAAPAPTVGYGKSKEGQHTSTAPHLSKPGFFRRVFGSARHHHAATAEPNLVRASTAVESSGRPCSKPQHIAAQVKGNHHPPQEAPPPPKDTPHVLTKRPSSFFRRRKKSISEPQSAPPVPLPAFAPPPVPRSQSENDKLAFKRPPSPVSSLRKVMTPYLKDPVRQPHESLGNHGSEPAASERKGLEDFSQEHTMATKAAIRAVKPASREGGEEGTPAAFLAQSKSYLDVDDAGPPFRSGSGSEIRSASDPTFLQDSSDNDKEVPKNLPLATTANSEVFGKRVASPGRPAPAAPFIAPVDEQKGANASLARLAVQNGMSASNSSLASAAGSESKMKPVSADKDEEWVMLTPARSTSKEQLPPALNLSLPLEGPKVAARESGSTGTGYKSATSLLASQTDDEEEPKSSPRLLTAVEAIKALDELQAEISDSEELTDGDREKAKKIYDGCEDFIQKSKAAAWLGEDVAVRRRALAAYMGLYDFTNLNILAALRLLCGRLVLRGESQQVDRILDGFAKRWCECNPNHGFKALDVVHAICFSILLLNTDLHLADIDSKMTRSQFVKNTMPTILRVVTDAAPDAFDSRPSILPRSHDKDLLSPVFKPSDEQLAKESEEKSSWRSSIRPPARTNSDDPPPTPLYYGSSMDDCGPLVKAHFHGTLRTWEVQVEIVLKDFYGSIRTERLPLFGAAIEKPVSQQQSQSSLSLFTTGMLRRTPSVLSKTPSENTGNTRGRTADPVRPATGRWASKNRSRPRIYPSSGIGSSRTSLDDQSSMWSPSVSSSTWSKYSLGKTQTSMSVDSFGSSYPQADYQQSIGFANALSQAIIREESVAVNGSGGAEELREAPLLEDESLELAGAPWAKEGIVKHKHHLEAVDKKAKDRNWNETFAVIEKGYMRLFSFSSKSMRNKSKSKATGGVVGGGNWQDNAENLGSFLLRQTIASALPPPGYSKARPHVWALSLPNGAVHLFQVGTPEIVREFVSSANYWSARLSNHPLVGGISNIEYGWSEAITNNSLVQAINETTRPSTSGQRPSLQSSLRSSLDHGGGSFRARLPGDKILVSDWMPPTQSMRASSLMEQDQLRTLITYVQGIEDELQKHNQLRSSMSLAFTPRHHNAQKAMANWEKKSSYLLREIVKFRTYIDCLQAAEALKEKIYAEREAHKEVKEGEDEGDSTLRPE